MSAGGVAWANEFRTTMARSITSQKIIFVSGRGGGGAWTSFLFVPGGGHCRGPLRGCLAMRVLRGIGDPFLR